MSYRPLQANRLLVLLVVCNLAACSNTQNTGEFEQYAPAPAQASSVPVQPVDNDAYYYPPMTTPDNDSYYTAPSNAGILDPD